MEKIIWIIAIFIGINNFCFSQEETIKESNKIVQKNMETIIYIHPVSGIYTSSIDAEQMGVCLYLTIENPLNLSQSLIIKPSAWINVREFKLFGKPDRYTRLGSDIGLRSYFNKKGAGGYSQLQMGVFHIRNVTENTNNIGFDAMIYFGYSKKKTSKSSIFFDVGLGCNFGTNPILSIENFLIVPDINIGIGFKL